jgi:hypothetical protein
MLMVKARRKGEKIKSWNMGAVWWKGWDVKLNIGTSMLVYCSQSLLELEASKGYFNSPNSR